MKVFIYRKDQKSALFSMHKNVSSVSENKTHVFVTETGKAFSVAYDKHKYKTVTYTN